MNNLEKYNFYKIYVNETLLSYKIQRGMDVIFNVSQYLKAQLISYNLFF